MPGGEKLKCCKCSGYNNRKHPKRFSKFHPLPEHSFYCEKCEISFISCSCGITYLECYYDDYEICDDLMYCRECNIIVCRQCCRDDVECIHMK